MNNCIRCINYHRNKSPSGKMTIHTCSQNKNVCVCGEMGNEPIVQNCGCFIELREYKKENK